MPQYTECARCQKGKRASLIEVACHRIGPQGDIELRGIVKCLVDDHEWPITIRDDVIVSTTQSLPISESAKLSSDVPGGIVQDVQEAERAHFAYCYKASVVMCRRAMQLALVDKGIADGPLGKMLDQARKRNLLTDRTDALVTGIQDYGGGAAHSKEEISAEEARMMIFTTVRVLNELFLPGKRSGTGSNET